ncbi:MAG TPA: hypothetical protein PKN33_01710 [Phycisphaerae bacterium]|nr:hypothetical protein [Phycisphaerae bacterium]
MINDQLRGVVPEPGRRPVAINPFPERTSRVVNFLENVLATTFARRPVKPFDYAGAAIIALDFTYRRAAIQNAVILPLAILESQGIAFNRTDQETVLNETTGIAGPHGVALLMEFKNRFRIDNAIRGSRGGIHPQPIEVVFHRRLFSGPVSH